METKQGAPMTQPTKQLIVITGPRGVGKSTLAATYLPPSKIERVVVIDNENSMNNFRQNLIRLGKDFGKYINTLERFKHKLPASDDLLNRIDKGNMPWTDANERSAFIDYYKHVLGEISELPAGKYDTLIVDTGERLEAGMAAYVEANKSKFGITDTGYGKLWINGVYPLYTYLLQGLWDRGISTVILTFHLKNVWEGKRPIPGKVTHAGKKLLYYLSSLMLWLVNDNRNPNGEPAGLVLKERMGRVETDGDDWNIKTMLPPRIPVCDWKHIRQYLETGYDIINPGPTEVRSEKETEMISELMTDAQIRLMLADAEIEREQNAIQMAESGLIPVVEQEKIEIGQNGDIPQTKAQAITKWKSLGKPLPALLSKLREKGIREEQIAERWDEVINE